MICSYSKTPVAWVILGEARERVNQTKGAGKVPEGARHLGIDVMVRNAGQRCQSPWLGMVSAWPYPTAQAFAPYGTIADHLLV